MLKVDVIAREREDVPAAVRSPFRTPTTIGGLVFVDLEVLFGVASVMIGLVGLLLSVRRRRRKRVDVKVPLLPDHDLKVVVKAVQKEAG